MIDQLVDAIKKAKKITVLTGAGVSTASGIPDYRSKNGLYTLGSPEYVLSHECLEDEPGKFYEFITENMVFPDAEPNNIHLALAEMQNIADVKIVTQNVDGLHQKAGSKKVVEFHGSLNEIRCTECHMKYSLTQYLETSLCSSCSGLLRPDVVLYDEAIDPIKYATAIDAVVNADLIIVIGTSMQVFPFASLIEYSNLEAKKILVNKEEVAHKVYDLTILDDANEVFRIVREALKMKKYRIPIIAMTYTEVEAENLEDAISQINSGDPDTPGIDKSEVDTWEIDEWRSVQVNGETITDKNGDLYLSDIMKPSDY